MTTLLTKSTNSTSATESTAGTASTSENTEASELRRRLTDTFDASRSGAGTRFAGGTGTGRLDERLRVVAERAAFYYKWPTIPNWPPRLLFNKIMRKVLKPILWPIVEFHFAVRDALGELRDRGEIRAQDQQESLDEALQRAEALETEVQSLKTEMASLAAQVEYLRATSTNGGDRAA